MRSMIVFLSMISLIIMTAMGRESRLLLGKPDCALVRCENPCISNPCSANKPVCNPVTRGNNCCATAQCSRDTIPSGITCGGNTCDAGYVCCNASCGICTPPDGFCTMQVCDPLP
eukprot:487212_1